MASSSPTPNPKTPGTGFPAAAFSAAVCAVALLLVWHLWKKAPGGGGMPLGVFRQAFSLHLRQKPVVKLARAPLNGVQGTLNGPPPLPKAGSLPAISPVFVDDSGALDPFFAALWHLEQAKTTHLPEPKAPAGPAPLPPAEGATDTLPAPGLQAAAPEEHPQPADVVTVLHYGDSPTTADLITGDARALLQARFGDAGHGFNLPAKPWAWYGHRDVTLSDSGWKALTPVGSMREGIYGLGGATLVGSTGAKSTFKLAGADQGEAELSYLAEPAGGSFSVSAGDTLLQTVSTDGPADTPAFALVKLPAGTREVELAVTAGTVKMLGADFRTLHSGVLYDSLGLNGATTSVMARGFGKATWPAELSHARPALIVINYGTNESSFGAWVNKGYENELRLAVAKVRSALPGVPILIMSPMDRGKRAGLNDIETMDTIPQIVAIQRRVAADLHCGFFDTFDGMGGTGTMADWYTGKPRLVSADLIHPTPQGALIVAQALVNNLLLGYDRWKHLHGIVVTTGAAPPSVVTRNTGPASGSGKPTAAPAKPAPPAAKREQLKTPEPKTPDTNQR
jgi:lysophospholipase L1-like esterase